jgi:hypothetical protein
MGGSVSWAKVMTVPEAPDISTSRTRSEAVGVHRTAIRWLIDGPDRVARRTTAKQRRAVHFWLTTFWLTAGTVIWLYLRSALWFVGLMSLYAIWVTHLAGWSAETPAEVEDEPPTEG